MFCLENKELVLINKIVSNISNGYNAVYIYIYIYIYIRKFQTKRLDLIKGVRLYRF